MAELRYDVHTNIQEVSRIYTRETERMIRQAERLTSAKQAADKVLSGGTGGAQVAQQQAQATDRRAQANTRLSNATTAVNRAMREEVALAERRQREDRQLRDQLERLTATTDRVANAERRRAQLQRTLEAAQRRGIVSHAEASRTLRDFDARQQVAAQGSRRFATSLQRLRESSVLLLGPLSGVGARIQTVSATMNTAGVAAVALVGSLAGAAGLIFAAQRTAAALDDSVKRADQLGISFARLQELRFVAARQGIQNIDRALEAFTKRIGEAAQGTGEAQNALDALGLSAERLEEIAPDQQLIAIAEAFGSVESEARRNAIAADLASRANQDLARIFALSREEIEALIERARELGLVLDESAARRSEELQDRLTELQFIVTQAGKNILSNLIPPLTSLIEKFVEGSVAAAEFYNNLPGPSGIEEREAQLEQLLRREAELVEEVQRIRERGERPAGGRLGLGDLSEISAITELQAVRAEIEFVQFALAELRRAQGGEGEGPLADLGAEARTSVEQVEELLGSIESLERRIAAFREGGAEALRVEVATQRAEETVGGLDSDVAREKLALRLDLIESAEQRSVSEQELISALRERILHEGELRGELESLQDPSADVTSATNRRAEAEREAALAIEAQIGALRQAAADRREELTAVREGEAAVRALETERAVEQALLEATVSALERGVPLRDEERRQIEAAVRAEREYAQAIEAEKDAREQAEKAAARAAEQREKLLREPFENAIEGTQRAFRDTFRSIFDEGIDGFEDFGDRILDLMKDVAAEIAALLVFRPILDQTGLGGILSGGQGQTAGLLGGQGGGFNLGSLTDLASLGTGGLSLASVLEQTGLVTLPPGQSTVIAGPPAPGTGGLSLGSVLNAVNVGSILGGLAASTVSSELGLSTNAGGSSVSGEIGTGVGSLAGAIVGSIIPGIGTLIGSFVGGVAGGPIFSGLEALFTGENPFEAAPGTSALGAGIRGGVLGAGLSLGAGGLATTLGLGGGVGGLTGALGLLGGPLGLGAGALLGAIAGIFSTGDISKSSLRVITGDELEDRRNQLRTFETPFGEFGLRNKNFDFSETLTAIDEVVAPLLSPEEIKAAAQRFEGRFQLEEEFASFDNEAVSLVVDHLDTILQGIAETGPRTAQFGNARITQLTNRLINQSDFERFGSEDFRRITEAILPEVQKFLAERAAVRETVRAFTESPLEEAGAALQPASDVEQAIAKVNQAFTELTAKAEELAFKQEFLAEIEEARGRALDLLTADFNREVELAALEITDPFAAASRRLAEEQERRLEDAEAIGADIAEVERLNLLEREELVERFYGRANESIRQLLQSLEGGPESPFAPEVQLEQAEVRFQSLLQAAQGGDLEARSELAGAAQNLLQASEAVFASSEMFQQRFEFVTRALGNLLDQVPNADDLPGFQHGGRFTVGGSGAIDDTLVAFRATRGETVTVAPAGEGTGTVEALLRELGSETAGGTGELSGLLESILSELRETRRENGDLRRRLDRLLAKQAAA